MWSFVYGRYPETIIEDIRRVGRVDKHRCWIFKNILITDSGAQIQPDKDGVFWTTAKSKGLRLKGVTADDEDNQGVPSLTLEKTREECKEILHDTVRRLSRNFLSLGPALMCIGWVKANLYSDDIFKADGGFGSLMIWGTHGQGKSTVCRWMQMFYGLSDKMASTSVQQLKSAVGFQRKGSYFASLPLFLDEIRADELTGKYVGMIRSWYDREARDMAAQESGMVKRVPVRSTLLMAGEDLPADSATKQRIIMLRMPYVDPLAPEMKDNFIQMNLNCQYFSNITYYWLRDYVNNSKNQVLEGIRALDRALVSSGCPNRVSKVWATAAYFAHQMALEICPEFDFMAWLIDAATTEQDQQKEDNVINNFFTNMATMEARVPPKITDQHFVREGSYIHIWFPAVYKEVNDDNRNQKDKWSKNAILRAIKEEPYYVSDNKKISLGLSGARRVVLTLDLEKAPEPLQSMVQYTPLMEPHRAVIPETQTPEFLKALSSIS